MLERNPSHGDLVPPYQDKVVRYKASLGKKKAIRSVDLHYLKDKYKKNTFVLPTFESKFLQSGGSPNQWQETPVTNEPRVQPRVGTSLGSVTNFQSAHPEFYKKLLQDMKVDFQATKDHFFLMKSPRIGQSFSHRAIHLKSRQIQSTAGLTGFIERKNSFMTVDSLGGLLSGGIPEEQMIQTGNNSPSTRKEKELMEFVTTKEVQKKPYLDLNSLSRPIADKNYANKMFVPLPQTDLRAKVTSSDAPLPLHSKRCQKIQSSPRTHVRLTSEMGLDQIPRSIAIIPQKSRDITKSPEKNKTVDQKCSVNVIESPTSPWELTGVPLTETTTENKQKQLLSSPKENLRINLPVIEDFSTNDPELRTPNEESKPENLFDKFPRFDGYKTNTSMITTLRRINETPATVTQRSENPFGSPLAGSTYHPGYIILKNNKRMAKRNVSDYITIKSAAGLHERNKLFEMYKQAYDDKNPGGELQRTSWDFTPGGNHGSINESKIYEMYSRFCIEQNIVPIPFVLGLVNKTKSLFIENHSLADDRHCQILGDLLHEFNPFITTIYLKNNSISNRGALSFIPNLNLNKLISFRYEYNTLGTSFGEVFENLFTSASYKYFTLKEISFAHCKTMNNFRFLNSFFSILANNILNLSNLEYLNLQNLFQGGQQIYSLLAIFCEFLSKTTSLTSLDISHNNLDSRAIMQLFDALAKNKSLRMLNLAWNSLKSPKNETADKIKSTLIANNETIALVHLNLSYTNMDDADMLLISQAMNESRSLQAVHFTGNQPTYKGLNQIRQLLESVKYGVSYSNDYEMRRHNEVPSLGARHYEMDNHPTVAQIYVPSFKAQEFDGNWNEELFHRHGKISNLQFGTSHIKATGLQDRAAPNSKTVSKTARGDYKFFENGKVDVIDSQANKGKNKKAEHRETASEYERHEINEPLVFFRFLEPDVYRNCIWRESEHCWICERWRKVTLDSTHHKIGKQVTMRASVIGLYSQLSANGAGQWNSGNNLYLFGTFTNWRPRPVMPSEISGLGDGRNVFAYTDYLPPGNHFFLLSHVSSVIFSDRITADINNILVQLREEDPPEAFNLIALLKKQRKRFIKHESVFKDFIEDSDELLRKMFDADCAANKLPRIVKQPEALTRVKETLYNRYYKKVKSSFLQAITHNFEPYPFITLVDFGRICKDAKILDANLKMTDIDRIFIATNFEVVEQENNPDKQLCRSEFLEVMVRLSFSKFPGLLKNKVEPVDILTKFMDGGFLDNLPDAMEVCDGVRHNLIYTIGVNDVLFCNLEILEKVFRKYRHPLHLVMSMKDARKFVNDTQFKISDRDFTTAFAFSKMSIIDEMNQTVKSSYHSMVFVEFLEFIVRVTILAFQESEDEIVPLHLKIDAVMEAIALIVGMKKAEFFDHPDYYYE